MFTNIFFVCESIGLSSSILKSVNVVISLFMNDRSLRFFWITLVLAFYFAVHITVSVLKVRVEKTNEQ